MVKPTQKSQSKFGTYVVTISGVPTDLYLWILEEAERECLTVSQTARRMLLRIKNEKTAEAAV
jgi:hypothetical protein